MIEAVKPIPTLTELYVYVTNGCNCACRHCWIVPDKSGRTDQQPLFIASDVFEASIREALPLGLKSIKLTGGEPTIHPQFATLLEILAKYGLTGRLETNGMEITASLAEKLQHCGVKNVSVSLDGATASTHDDLRDVCGGFDRTLSGIGRLVEAGYRPEIIMSLLGANLDELEELVELAVDLGACHVKLNVVQPALRGKMLHDAGEVLSVAEILSLNTRIQEDLQKRCKIPIFLDVPMAFRPLNRMVNGEGFGSCGIRGILGLLADGQYALCGIGEHIRDLVFGRAGVGLLTDIWSRHPLLSELRDGLPDRLPGVCRKCLMKNVCLGSCIAMNYQQGQELFNSYWFCERAYAEALFPKSRLKDPIRDLS